MIGPLADMRPLIPTAEHWTLHNGAYLDGEEIVLPAYDAAGEIVIPMVGATRFTHRLTRVWTDLSWANRNIARIFTYLDARRHNNVKNLNGYYNNGAANTPSPTTSPWGAVAGFQAHFDRATDPLTWLRLRVRISTTYGTPGTRFIPTPEDLQVFYA